MPARRLPVRPDLNQLRHQAKDLLRAIHRGEPEALQDLQEFHPQPPDPANAKLADAQLTLARSYDAASWPRLVVCCNLIDAIWDDDVETVRSLVLKHPNLLTRERRNQKQQLGTAPQLRRRTWDATASSPCSTSSARPICSTESGERCFRGAWGRRACCIA